MIESDFPKNKKAVTVAITVNRDKLFSITGIAVTSGNLEIFKLNLSHY